MKTRNILLNAATAAIVFLSCAKSPDSQGEVTPGGEVNPPEKEEQWTEGYPKGVRVEEFSDELDGGKKCLGIAATIDFKANPSLKFTSVYTVPKKVPSTIYKEYGNKNDKACIVVNGGYFAGTTSASLCISDGIFKASGFMSMNWPNDEKYEQTVYPVRSALGQMEDGSFEIRWAYQPDPKFRNFYAYPSALGNDEKSKTFLKEAPTADVEGAVLWTPVNAIGGGPRLVENGKNVAVENYWKEVLDSGGTAGTSRQPRTAAGITKDGKLILIVCDGRGMRGSAGFTLSELADKFIALGAADAMNFDGGGSSAMVGKDGKVLNRPSDTGTSETIVERKVVTSIVISERAE